MRKEQKELILKLQEHNSEIFEAIEKLNKEFQLNQQIIGELHRDNKSSSGEN